MKYRCFEFPKQDLLHTLATVVVLVRVESIMLAVDHLPTSREVRQEYEDD